MTVAAAAPGLTLRDALDRLAYAHVFFAHRSVGADIARGVARLAAEAGSEMRVARVADHLPDGIFGHAWLQADEPSGKLRDLERLLGTGIGRGVRVAVFKFCYADFVVRMDVSELFRVYARSIDALGHVHPRVTFVHVTVPLVSVRAPSRAKAFAHALLGRDPVAVEENDRREEFNELLRRRYGGREPVFDLALAESTPPGGARVTHGLRGRPVPAMASCYTDDGGHLNGMGQVAMARQLVATLAEAA